MARIENEAGRPGHRRDQSPGVIPRERHGLPTLETDQMLVTPILG
jgi:hypothetical protein